MFIIGWYLFDGSNEAPLPSDWTTVQEMVEKGDVEKIQAMGNTLKQAVVIGGGVLGYAIARVLIRLLLS